MDVGYVRISSREQNTARQDVIMSQLGVEKIYTDRISGKSMERPELQRMLDYVRDGDSLTVESISRLARNTKDLLEIVELLTAKNVRFISKKEALDTSTPAGRFMLTIFGAVAELEREYIRDRQREGIDIAKAEGKYNGRPLKMLEDFDVVYQHWKSNQITASAAAKQLDVSRSTFYRRVERYEDDVPLDFGDNA